MAVMGVIAGAVAVLVVRLPVGTCKQCAHCADVARRKKEEQKRAADEYARKMWGVDKDDRKD